MGLTDKFKGLSKEDERRREAAFEAMVLAELNKDAKRKASDGIHITLVLDGKEVRYEKLSDVPLAVRQRIVSEWLASGG